MDVYDTLVITGNLSLSSGNLRNIVVHNGGLLIVLGNFSATNNSTALVDVNAGGNFVVVGDYNQQQGSVTSTGGFYAFDNTPTFNWGSSVDGTAYNNNTGTLTGLLDDENDLVANNNPLNQFLETLGIKAVCSATPTYITKNGAGGWTTNNDWVGNTRPPYTLSSGTYTIPAGHIVTIESGNFSLTSNLIVYGTLIVNGTLNMTGGGTVIDIQSGGSVTCCKNCNPSNKINIGGNTAWTGNDGTVNGPAIINSSGILPVTLVFFKEDKDTEGVNLLWGTATEENADFFQIERSIKGISFEKIGKVNASGNSNQLINYNFTDEKPFQGKNYYRLKTVDYDGSYEYSKIISVDYEVAKQFNVYPNPYVNGNIHFNTNFAPQEDDMILVLNTMGVEVTRILSTTFDKKFQIDSLKPGVYFFKYHSTNFEKTIRIVKAN